MAFYVLDQFSSSCQGRRKNSGSIATLILTVTGTVVLTLLLFSLGVGRMIGTSHEQKSSIEAAALIAAKDLSSIVIDDPNFGLIGISDSAPIGSATTAADGYFTQVHGINTLFATIRLDMIIANQLNDPVMMRFAQRDYNNARQAANSLVAVLQQSLLPESGSRSGGTGSSGNFLDAYGNPVSPYNDAVAAYRANQVRMAGASEYVTNSMKLTLGSLLGGAPTNTPIPKPETYAYAGGDLSANGNYNSYVNASYNNTDFVFAGVGTTIKLVDLSKFTKVDDSLPYTIPTIVKAEADQKLLQGNNTAGQVIHAVACAQPASALDPFPAPGKLTITVLGQQLARLTKPTDLLTDPEVSTPKAVLSVATGGDVPGGGSFVPGAWPINGTPTIGNVFSAGIYDWLRMGGTKPQVDAVLAMMHQVFLSPAGTITNVMQSYEFEADGTILQTLLVSGSTPVLQESDEQMHAAATFTNTDSFGNNTNYNLLVRNWVYQPGRLKGGIHAGGPLPDALLDAAPLAQNLITGTSGGSNAAGASSNANGSSSSTSGTLISFPQGPGSGPGAVRNTYTHNGLDVDFQIQSF